MRGPIEARIREARTRSATRQRFRKLSPQAIYRRRRRDARQKRRRKPYQPPRRSKPTPILQSPSRCSILLVDEHKISLTAIASLLQAHPHYEIMALATDGDSALARILDPQLPRPDIVITEITLPGLVDGLELSRQVRLLKPWRDPQDRRRIKRTRTIILTQWESPRHVTEAFRSGASGYVLKRSELEELPIAISQARQGKVYLTPALPRSLLDQVAHDSPASVDHLGRAERIRRRGIMALKLLASGWTRTQIHLHYRISFATIKQAVDMVRARTGIRDRGIAAVVRYVVEHEDLLEMERAGEEGMEGDHNG